MKLKSIVSLVLLGSLLPGSGHAAQTIPLAEHPRPDFERKEWQNLNGVWEFEFDSLDIGIEQNWASGNISFTREIMVPFPWGSPLSGVKNEADIGWYKRELTVNPDWEGKSIFLVIGACDWETIVWLDGQLIGKHQGGYVPFSFELTDWVTYGRSQELVIRADDIRREFTLYGKQGYGDARGIWQTVYLEARGPEYLDAVHFTPDIDHEKVTMTAYLTQAAERDLNLLITVKTESDPIAVQTVLPTGKNQVDVDIPIPDPHLWTLEDPFLYHAEVAFEKDTVLTYFGMRKISVVHLPGTDIPYIALNNKPVYLQLALDQSYHPEGYYTFPSDAFVKGEIERAKSIGLNGIRPHIKVEIPRKLYWADRLGLLVMQDLPNSWGEPDESMRRESEYTLREMIKRDYNHPAIFSWILFNETWGLRTRVTDGESGRSRSIYLPKTQYWVASMVYLAKSLDPTRLVEDNSICCGTGHTETDIVSYHEYLPGWQWEERVKRVSGHQVYGGGSPLFEAGFALENQPVINSECGNVWGYEGSTGDVDWSWDYHRMINTFRKYPQIAGWLYTEHHDVVNEWNGYWRYDRTEKYTGLGEIMEGMTVNDFHALVYLSTGNEICLTRKGGEKVTVPLYLSSMTDQELGNTIRLFYQLTLTNSIGESAVYESNSIPLDYHPYIQSVLDPMELKLPDVKGLATLKLWLEDMQGNILHRNFMHFEVESDSKPVDGEVVSIAPNAFSDQNWSLKQWDVLDGLKVNGAGNGYFEYTLFLPEHINMNNINEAYFLIELSAKQLFVKDIGEMEGQNFNYMLGDRDDPSRNPNAYPMTDETTFSSEISVSVNGTDIFTTILPDDPADHRGVLSWHHQLLDRRLREAGSYGYLIRVSIPDEILQTAAKTGKLIIRIKTHGGGGIAVYGESFGRYPLDPSLVLRYK